MQLSYCEGNKLRLLYIGIKNKPLFRQRLPWEINLIRKEVKLAYKSVIFGGTHMNIVFNTTAD